MASSGLNSEASLTKAERIEALMRLAHYHHDRWKTKNATEWRVAFATWAVLLASPIYIRQRPDAILMMIALFGFSVGYCFHWSILIARKNHFEVSLSFYYVDIAEKIALDVPLPHHNAVKKWIQLSKAEKARYTRAVLWSAAFWFQILATVLISVLVYQLVGRIAPSA